MKRCTLCKQKDNIASHRKSNNTNSKSQRQENTNGDWVTACSNLTGDIECWDGKIVL